MHLRNGQTGATLILILGILTVLVILAAALVMLSSNVVGNSRAQSAEVKAFNVAEAGLDTGQATLWAAWPGPGETTPTVDPAAFENQFPKFQFPAPMYGREFIDVQFYDDDGGSGINRAVHVDENDNGIMWIESSGATGSGAAKVMAKVERVEYDLMVRPGVAWYSEGNLTIQGTGNQPVVGLDPPATAAQVLARGSISMNGQAAVQAGVQTEQYTSTTLQDVFPSEILLGIIEAGKSFATWGAYTSWKSSNPGVEPFATDPRIIIIENGDVDAKDIPETDTHPATGLPTVWSEEDPGILVVLNGNFDATGQKKTIYGIVYVVNGFDLGGNAEVHGMVVAKASGRAHGTRAVVYNPNVMKYLGLQGPLTLTVKRVPNTWRELQPPPPSP
jgi:hypothetical protein